MIAPFKMYKGKKTLDDKRWVYLVIWFPLIYGASVVGKVAEVSVGPEEAKASIVTEIAEVFVRPEIAGEFLGPEVDVE